MTAPSPSPSVSGAAAALGAGRPRRFRVGPLLLLVGVLALLAWWALRGASPSAGLSYTTQPAALGPLEVTVSATGNLQPTNQVDIGSELSGTITEVLVAVNDRVQRGQVLARLDTARLADTVALREAAVAQAQAQVQQAAATTLESRTSLQRLQQVQRLSGGQVPSALELATAEAALARAVAAEAAAVAAVQQARASLNSDRTNLSKAVIRSPIAGVVLAREVEPGQTVAASLQAVTLFTLAEDLQQMQLEVSVDEADVGQVHEGQAARFSVDAWPDRRYPAQVQRVGLGSTTTNNVVSYLTVLTVDNADLSLRPGMTATADITTLSRQTVLRVPNAALRWSPPAPPAQAPSGGVLGALMPRPPREPARQPAASIRSGSQQQVWVLDGQGRPAPVPVTAGATDGKFTEITGGELKAGQAVVTDSRASGA